MLLRRNDWPGVGALWRGVAAWYQRDALYHELAALDERELKDIGITRGDIPAVVEGTFSRSGGCCDGVGDTRRLWARPPDHPVRCASTPPRK